MESSSFNLWEFQGEHRVGHYARGLKLARPLNDASDAHCPPSLSLSLSFSLSFYFILFSFAIPASPLSSLFLFLITLFSFHPLFLFHHFLLLYTFFLFLSHFFPFLSFFPLPSSSISPSFFAPRISFPVSLSLYFLFLPLSLSPSFFMGSIRTGSLTVQDGMKRFGMGWSGAGSNSWTNEPTDRTAGACSQIDARGSSWAPLFVYLLHPLYSLLTLLILVHSPLQDRKG